MTGKSITVDDFFSICRVCLCDCTDQASFQIDMLIFENKAVGDVLMDCASIKVSPCMMFVFNMQLDVSFIFQY